MDKQELFLTLRPEGFSQDPELLTDLGYALEYGTLFAQDYAAAFRLYTLAAEAGDARAVNNLGYMYLEGHGVEKDFDKARELFEKAAEKGETTAMVNLGNMYEDGVLDGSADYEKALCWYREAGMNGNEKGALNFATMLHFGLGTEENREAAYNIFSLLYDEGCQGAAFYLGYYHQEGIVVEQDYDKAERYYLTGTLEKDAYCYNQLGVMYGQGLGVKKNPETALYYYRQAAELGDSLACSNIAWLYETGDGVEKDLDEAVRWYRRAAMDGEEHALEALERLKVPADAG